ncbi:MAG: CoA-binding protein [Deltaproteobacteria bacterium]|nr:CoA-binding protein [Deltaproteobacteria bacterium]
MVRFMSSEPKITLDNVFHPKSVAIIGVSPEKPGFASQIMGSLMKANFPVIYPVNPNYQEAFGFPCYPSVSSIPGPVDHVVVAVPAAKTLELLDDCARKGVVSVHFFSAGFRETGEAQGEVMEEVMLQKARAGGFRIIGPNCTGLFVPGARFIPTNRLPATPGPVSFISQSGGHAMDMPFHAGPRGMTFSKVMSYGNALDINECELLEYLTDDDDSEIIAVYIEGVRDGRRFYHVLEEICRKKPVVIYKGGTTDAGFRATQSHTASMTSSAAVFDAACRQVNAIRVDDIDEMIDVLVALRFARPCPAGRNMAVAGLGGGPSVLASDQMERIGLHLPPLSPELRAELNKILPTAGAIFSNPLDATNIVQPDVMYGAMKILGGSPSIHMMLYHMGFHPVTQWGNGRFANAAFLNPAAEALRKVHEETNKPVLLALGPPSDPTGAEEMFKVQEAFVGAGLPCFHSLEKAALAMLRVENWYRRFNIS